MNAGLPPALIERVAARLEPTAMLVPATVSGSMTCRPRMPWLSPSRCWQLVNSTCTSSRASRPIRWRSWSTGRSSCVIANAALLLLVPAGAGHAASSLDNSFEPLPLMRCSGRSAPTWRRKLPVHPRQAVDREVKHVLGRHAKVETVGAFPRWARADPTADTAGRDLWQVGLVPGPWRGRPPRPVAAKRKGGRGDQPTVRPTARVIDRLEAAEVRAGPVRQELQAFLEQQDAGALADAVKWTREIGEQHPGEPDFRALAPGRAQSVGLQQVKVTPFRKEDGTVDSRSKLRLDENDGQLYCEVRRTTRHRRGAVDDRACQDRRQSRLAC